MSDGLYCLRALDAVLDLAPVYSTDETTLRAFGASYMRDPKTIGSLALIGPDHDLRATFDVWTDAWAEADTVPD